MKNDKKEDFFSLEEEIERLKVENQKLVAAVNFLHAARQAAITILTQA